MLRVSLMVLAALPGLAAYEEVMSPLEADDECAVGGEEGACGLNALQLHGKAVLAAGGYYIERDLVADQGQEITVRQGLGLQGCKDLCDRTPNCHSFTFGVAGDDNGKCYLKTRVVRSSDQAANWGKSDYKTYYKTGGS